MERLLGSAPEQNPKEKKDELRISSSGNGILPCDGSCDWLRHLQDPEKTLRGLRDPNANNLTLLSRPLWCSRQAIIPRSAPGSSLAKHLRPDGGDGAAGEGTDAEAEVDFFQAAVNHDGRASGGALVLPDARLLLGPDLRAGGSAGRPSRPSWRAWCSGWGNLAGFWSSVLDKVWGRLVITIA